MRLSAISTMAVAVALAAFPVLAASASAKAADPAEPAAAPDAAQADGGGNAIIVTGTRASGVTQAQSATPIKVLSSDALATVGQPSLSQALTQLVPSFSAQAFGGDTSNLTLSAKLRGLSPNHTLVLVNGKRRHGTANLAVLGGPYQGSAAADLDMIPVEAIDHIEVLEQGAAAQYGSDAIAGVINIILKKNYTGGEIEGTGGSNYNTGGLTGAVSVNKGFKLGKDGFLNVTVFHRYHDHTQNGGLDGRITDPSGTMLSGLPTAVRSYYSSMSGYPNVNKINGDAESHLTNLAYNAGYDLDGGVSLYSFGTYGHRVAYAYENERLPSTIVGSSTLGTSGTIGSSGANIYAPSGFDPLEAIREDDLSFTAGARGTLAGFGFDLSGTWGQDHEYVYTLDSGNKSLFVNTGSTPANFYDGSFRATEMTFNADFTHDINLGLAEPLNLAFGAEYRKNVYAITAGDYGSTYAEGGQSYPGFRSTDAASHSRHNVALYADVTAHPVEKWMIEPAVRWEHYSDFGSTTTYKVTSRYDFAPAFALRGTISTGFRAPTLAEEYYSATNVSPTTATVQLPANSAAAKILGFSNLKPEKSTNYSLGAVFHPIPKLTMTVDVYQVRVRNRILGSSTIYGLSGGVAQPYASLVNQAIATNGNILDSSVTTTGVSVFTNAADTRTRGVDVVMSYPTDFGRFGHVNWTLSGTYNETKATRIYDSSSLVSITFDKTAISYLETASPKVKLINSADWSKGKFDVNLRGTLYTSTKEYVSPNGSTYYLEKIPTAYIVDLNVTFKANSRLTLTMGANNLLDTKPPTVPILKTTYSVNGVTYNGYENVGGGYTLNGPMSFSPYGVNGGYYYGKIAVKF